MTTDDQKIAALLQTQRQHIADHGRSIGYVFDPYGKTAPYGYTIGLTEHGDGHPEFLIAGPDPEITSVLLNDMAHRVLTLGERFTHGQTVTDLLDGLPVVLVTGPTTDSLHPGALYRHYGDSDGAFSLLQIVWPDPAGRYPWQDGYAYPAHIQPTLGRP